MSTEKVKNALRALREAVPEYFESRICYTDCPSEWDLKESCRHSDLDAKAKNCLECWKMALEDE